MIYKRHVGYVNTSHAFDYLNKELSIKSYDLKYCVDHLIILLRL